MTSSEEQIILRMPKARASIYRNQNNPNTAKSAQKRVIIPPLGILRSEIIPHICNQNPSRIRSSPVCIYLLSKSSHPQPRSSLNPPRPTSTTSAASQAPARRPPFPSLSHSAHFPLRCWCGCDLVPSPFCRLPHCSSLEIYRLV